MIETPPPAYAPPFPPLQLSLAFILSCTQSTGPSVWERFPFLSFTVEKFPSYRSPPSPTPKDPQTPNPKLSPPLRGTFGKLVPPPPIPHLLRPSEPNSTSAHFHAWLTTRTSDVPQPATSPGCMDNRLPPPFLVSHPPPGLLELSVSLCRAGALESKVDLSRPHVPPLLIRFVRRSIPPAAAPPVLNQFSAAHPCSYRLTSLGSLVFFQVPPLSGRCLYEKNSTARSPFCLWWQIPSFPLLRCWFTPFSF